MPPQSAAIAERDRVKASRSSGWTSWLTLAAALLLLNASVTFRNVWPTPAIAWSGELSIELAAATLGLVLISRWRGRVSPGALRALAVVWLLLVAGRYIRVTAPALWGRELNFYWDLHFLPDVAAMLAGAASGWLTAAAAAAGLVAAGLAYLAVKLSWRRLADAAVRSRESRVLAVAGAIALGLFVAQRAGVRVPRAIAFPEPVTAAYARQARFVIQAAGGARALPPSPALESDLGRIQGADVLLLFVESYGAITFDQPEFNRRLDRPRTALARAIQTAGFDVASAYVESPTFGGSSWLAHITLMSGIEVRDPDTNALLMTARRDTLPTVFARRGYRSIAVMPGLWYPWPEGAFYGFADVYNGDRLQYRGAPFGWWSLPDQFTLAKLDAIEVNRTPRAPLFIFYPTVSTHTPFAPTPPYQPDWARLLTDKPFDDEELARAYEVEPDWMNLAPSYLASVEYAYEMLAGYVTRHAGRNLAIVVIGDHQPPALVTGEGAPWDVPVHVITNRAGVLDQLRRRGFRAGVTPQRPHLGKMHALTPMLLEAFGSDDRNHEGAKGTKATQ